MDISFVIISWNDAKYIKVCLDSLLASTSSLSKEIIFIDNGSQDSTREIIRSYTNTYNINFITIPKNLGVAKARNVGIKHSKGKYICFLDIDTITNEKAIISMLQFMENTENCGICAPKLTNSQLQIQNSCRKYPSFKFKLYNILESRLEKYPSLQFLQNKIKQLNTLQFYTDYLNFNYPFEVEYVIGACQMIRKKAIETVGFLDENIFYGPEDADYCLRMKKQNWTIFYLPQVSMIHEHQRKTNKKIFSKIGFAHIKSSFYFFYKHKRRFQI